jgi:hypothetical protein
MVVPINALAAIWQLAVPTRRIVKARLCILNSKVFNINYNYYQFLDEDKYPS